MKPQAFIFQMIWMFAPVCCVTYAPAQDVVTIDADAAATRIVAVSALMRSAADRSAEAESAMRAADALRLPDVSLQASVMRQNSVPEFELPITVPGVPSTVLYPNIENTGQAGVAVQQRVYSGGTVKAQRNAARVQREGTAAQERVVQAELILASQLTYWQAVAAQAALDTAAAHVRRAQRLVDDTDALRQAGMAVDADVYAAQSRLAMAQVDWIRRQAAAENALAQLRSLLHMDADTKLQLADRQAPDMAPPPDDAALVARALASRAELQVLDSRGQVLDQQAMGIDGTRRPAVAATAGWELARPNQRYFPIEDAWHDSWHVGIVASWNVFDGGRARHRADGIRHQRDALGEEREEQVRQITLNVITARRDLIAATAAVDAAEAARKAAVARDRTATERYDAGLAPLSDVLDGQAELAEAELAVIRARADTAMARARLNRAVGR